MAKVFPQFEHNYNQVSREVMYNWFNKHLKLGQPEPVVGEAVRAGRCRREAVGLRRAASAAEGRGGRRAAAAAADGGVGQADRGAAAEGREGPGRVSPGDRHGPARDDPRRAAAAGGRGGEGGRRPPGAGRRHLAPLSAEPQGRRRAGPGRRHVPGRTSTARSSSGSIRAGKSSLFKDGKLVPEAAQILDGGAGIFAVDVFGIGELALDKPPAVDPKFAGYHLLLQQAAAGPARPRHSDGRGLRPRPREDEAGRSCRF